MSDYDLASVNTERTSRGLATLTPDHAERIARIKGADQDVTQFLINYVITSYRPGIMAKRVRK